MNKRRAFGCMLCTLAGLLAGCNALVGGAWRSIEPADVSPDAPRIRQVEFRQDGQFQGSLTVNNHTTATTGTWRFDGIWLTLLPDGKGERLVYRVARTGSVLRLTQNDTSYCLCREPAGTVPATPAAAADQTPSPSAPASQAVSAPMSAAVPVPSAASRSTPR
jgi:hypothetical protein